MSEDIAFKIQLGIILPKLKDSIGSNLSTIIEELVTILQAGTLEGEESVSMDAVKGIIMKDLEIFLDDSVLPPIDKKFNPPIEEPVAEAAEEEVAEAEAV
jgi:hypothetical protein